MTWVARMCMAPPTHATQTHFAAGPSWASPPLLHAEYPVQQQHQQQEVLRHKQKPRLARTSHELSSARSAHVGGGGPPRLTRASHKSQSVAQRNLGTLSMLLHRPMRYSQGFAGAQARDGGSDRTDDSRAMAPLARSSIGRKVTMFQVRCGGVASCCKVVVRCCSGAQG